MKFKLKQFDWDKGSRQLIGDASTLGLPVDAGPWPQILDIESHHTGVTERFNRSESMMSPEGTFLGMAYEPANMGLGIRVTVFNS